MNGKQIALATVLADFAALTAYAVYSYGFGGVLDLMLANAVTITLLADLTIALGLVTVWMVQDARDRGWSPIPYVLLTLTMGSVGPLVYLIRRAQADREPAGELATFAARG
jgi:hypothetical protein